MKVGRVMLSVMLAMSWWMTTPSWAGGEDRSGTMAERQYQSVTEELMGMLKETMSIIRNLDHAPTAEEKRQLAEMMSRLDAMLRQQQQVMEDMRDQLDSIRQQQDEFFQRQRIIQQQQNLPQQ
jgi:hypothetical protein